MSVISFLTIQTLFLTTNLRYRMFDNNSTQQRNSFLRSDSWPRCSFIFMFTLDASFRVGYFAALSSNDELFDDV
jgi:hypothetical protein